MTYFGTSVSSGVAIAPAFIYNPYKPEIISEYIKESQMEHELERYELVKEKSKIEIEKIKGMLKTENQENAKIFDAHIDMIYDEAMEDEIRISIKEKHSLEYAINISYDKYIKILGEKDDHLIRERVADMKDVKKRLLRVCSGIEEQNLSNLPENVIIFSYDLLPSDTATLDKKHVSGIVTEIGGITSHSAIIAKMYQIPAVLGVSDIISNIKNGDNIILDALNGTIFINPNSEHISEYEKKLETYIASTKELDKYKNIDPIMQDGTKIDISINIGSADISEISESSCCSGVGLFRSEFMYMGRNSLPSEDYQFNEYKKILIELGDKPVILRTLDVGGDKQIQTIDIPKEQNPFLGLRAIRLSLQNVDLFKTQLRAAFRASIYGNLWVMFPMVCCIEDIRQAKSIVHEVKNELDKKNKKYNKNTKIGVMIEVPSIALISDIVATEVDFASIGTNDLCQYSMAVDRLNPLVSKYYQNYNPFMFRIIKIVSDAFNLQNKPISVCGEMAGDPHIAAILIGLGINKLSMGISSIAPVKKLISNLTTAKAQRIANVAMTLSSASEVESYLTNELELFL